jgi:16S rRNA (adenine1518-N6/adenine1519-N6)-dimethyltransferase
MNLSEMRRLLEEHDIQLTKSLGQNFLHDGNQLRRIVEAAELQGSDKVLEIGPGLGPLTELLVSQASQVLAVEMDGRLVEVMRDRFNVSPASRRLPPTEPAEDLAGARPALRLLHADALEWLRRERRDWSDWKLVANLPYSVASPILVELAQSPQPPERMVVTLQHEVAQRLMAEPHTADYGVLTLLVQLAFEPRDRFKIPASCFFPEPDVGSACVTLRRRPQPLIEPELVPGFARLVKLAFSQRRKMMLKLLKQSWPADKLELGFAETGIPLQSRAEAVTLAQFVELTNRLVRSVA